MYIVISKPKRKSVYCGVIQVIVVSVNRSKPAKFVDESDLSREGVQDSERALSIRQFP